ncbi:MAG TPA: tyrosine-type recombinase/integrase, partial [Ktedonobacteraceae bacterium]|nr:tyrosine-type recombinase/integrase [Ktedonobacteraceae bacterium]
MLQEVIDKYIASLSLKEQGRDGTNQNTVVAYRNDLNQVCAYFKRQQIENWQQVTHEHIAGYLLEMREGQAYRPSTIARKLAALKTFFRYMQNTGIITSDPIEKLDAPRIQRGLPHVLSQEQISNLFRQVDVETPAGKRDLAMLHMLYATGMRVSELISLDLGDLDAESATVVCPGRNGRSKRERVLPLSTIVVETTKRYLMFARPGLIVRHPDEQALFLNHHGERLTRQGFWLIIKGYARQAGIIEI